MGGAISCTPLYYQPFLDRFPQRIAEVCGAITRAEPGGVAVHCGGGRDRTGLIVVVLLALVGAEPADIASGYALSQVRRAELCARVGLGDDTSKIKQLIAQHGTSEDELIREAATSRDMAAPALRRDLRGGADCIARQADRLTDCRRTPSRLGAEAAHLQEK
ncbi:tyrosine-protein phosphatase [Saccharopolyspora sp. NPDC000995]